MFFNFFLYSQVEGVATYKLKLISKDENQSSKKLSRKINEALEQSKNELKNLQYELIFNENLALYKEKEKLISDSQNSISSKLSKIFSGYFGEVYINLEDNILIKNHEFLGKNYYVEKKINDFDWKIEDSIIKINGYNCYAANTILTEEGRNGLKEIVVTAWFTPEINFPYGPNGYSGLPGMIVQIQKGNTITYLSKIKFENHKEKLEIPSFETISNTEFNQIIRDFSLNRRMYFKDN
jgi:GLPGLI family protein